MIEMSCIQPSSQQHLPSKGENRLFSKSLRLLRLLSVLMDGDLGMTIAGLLIISLLYNLEDGVPPAGGRSPPPPPSRAPLPVGPPSLWWPRKCPSCEGGDMGKSL